MSGEIQPVGPLKGPTSVPSEVSKSKESTGDSGVSTIEESKLVATLLVPIISFPLLTPPKEANTVDGLSTIMTRSQSLTYAFLFEMTKKMSDITQEVLDKWGENIQELKEELKKIMSSPQFMALEKMKKEEGIGKITTAGGNAVHDVKSVHENIAVTLDHLEKLGNNPKDNLFTYTLLFSIGGGLALGAVDPKNAAVPTIERLVEYVQPMASHLSIQDTIPVINLMVMAPIFYRFLDEAVSNIKNKAPQDTAVMVNNFAKDVIKMVGDPTFALLSVVNNSEKINKLNPQQKQELVALMKLILASIALSLLYSLEVGKLKGNQFMGMEIKEFRAILKGEIELPQVKKNMTETDMMTKTLINQIRFLLDVELINVPGQTKDQFINGLSEFLGQSQKLDGLIDPAKDFSKVLTKAMDTMDFKLPLPNILYG